MKSVGPTPRSKPSSQRYAAKGIGDDLALRVYTTRLLGGDPRLVLHGGGNTSVKTQDDRPAGRRRSRCSASRAPAGTWAISSPPGCRRCGSRRCAVCARSTNSPTRTWSISSAPICSIPRAPNPSVETLLHAFLPHKFIDHTHSTAVLALTDQPERRGACREVYRRARRPMCPISCRVSRWPRRAADVFDADPAVEGLVLLKHGIFTFGDDCVGSL